MVLLGLHFGSTLLNRHFIPLPYRVLGRRGAADRRHQITEPLHEFNDFLHRLPLSFALGLSLPEHWVQLNPPIIQTRENLQILGVHGPHGAPHKLPQFIPIDQLNPLPARNIPLERLPPPYHLQEQRLRLEKLGIWRSRAIRRRETVPPKLLLVHPGFNHDRGPPASAIERRVPLRHHAAPLRTHALRHSPRPRRQYRHQRQHG